MTSAQLSGWRSSAWLAFGIGAALPFVVALVLVPLRDDIDNANVALILSASVVAVGLFGRRAATVAAAVSAMVWFDFFHTRPYESFTINSHDDVITAIVLLAVGIAVGEIAIRMRKAERAAEQSSQDIARIHAIAELVASGEDPDMVGLTVATELNELLSLKDCAFERGVGPPSEPMAVLERSGDVRIGELRWGVHQSGFPADKVLLEVQGGGVLWGHYVLVRTVGVPISFDRRVVAVALADQVGAAYAARRLNDSSSG
jgi:K+-sensing histidine kinase KdpD